MFCGSYGAQEKGQSSKQQTSLMGKVSPHGAFERMEKKIEARGHRRRPEQLKTHDASAERGAGGGFGTLSSQPIGRPENAVKERNNKTDGPSAGKR